MNGLSTMKCFFSALTVAVVGISALAAPEFGKPVAEWIPEKDFAKAAVYVSEGATDVEVAAARMLMRAQIMIAGGEDTTNVTPRVAAEFPANGIVVGWLESPLYRPFADKLGLKPWKEAKNGTDMIAQYTCGATLILAGNAPESAFFAVADLLYRNGARFIHTGTLEDGYSSGVFLEYMKELRAPAARVYTPLAAIRTGFALDNRLPKSKQCTQEQWVARNMFALMNCASTEGGRSPLNGGHTRGFFGSECIQPAYHDFDKHRDFFPMNKEGQRFRPVGGWCWVMEGCWSNPEFLDWVIDRVAKLRDAAGPDKSFGFDVTNSDGGPKCLCPDCEKLRASYPDVSSYYFDYNMKIQKALKERYPDMKVETLAYIMSREYPKTGNKFLKYMDAVDYCPYSRCYVHLMNGETCPTNQRDIERLLAWKGAGIPIGDFDYCFDVFNPGMSMPTWEMMADLIQYWKKLNGANGLPRMYMESATSPNGNGGKSRIAAYVAARCLWDDGATADEHLRDWCRVGFGPAAETMLAYYRAASKAWIGQSAHLTGTFNNPLGTAKSYFTPELRKVGEDAFASAAKALDAALAAATAPREKNLLGKQIATLAFEKKCFDEWKALNDKAMSTSLQVNVEEGDGTPGAFDRMPKYTMKESANSTAEDATGSFVQFLRTKEAIRVRVTSHGPLFKKTEWRERRTDDGEAYGPNSMEFFIQAPGQTVYYQLAVSATGVMYDGQCLDGGWNSDLWKAESKSADGLWELTLTIPFALFGDIVVKDGDIFKFVAINNSQRTGEDGKAKGYNVGLPYPAYHDMAIGIDLRIDDNVGRRAGE